jgi:S-adenosylmethionine:tRNA ribosyltransferase-isomerase
VGRPVSDGLMPSDLLTSDFDFDLPPERIAQTAIEPRDRARLLHVGGQGLTDHHVYDLPELLRGGDLLVMNDTKVIPARLYGKRGEMQVEILLHKKQSSATWLAFARPGKRLRAGDRILFGSYEEESHYSSPLEGEDAKTWACFGKPLVFAGEGVKGEKNTPSPAKTKDLPKGKSKFSLPPPQGGRNFLAEILEKHEGGEILIRFNVPDEKLLPLLELYGEAPLPPYIHRAKGAAKKDRERYQTIYAKREGAVAAPTAGLHFTSQLLAQLGAKGIDYVKVTLHVGAGTFLPVKAKRLADHVMHAEWGEISAATAERVNQARREGRRIVAVGTTSLRLLESAADETGTIRPFAGDTSIFIYPGYRFKAVDALMTNFHLPKSTLFMLVCAFAGSERMRSAYNYAIAQNYRFYSYGDATLLEKER